MTTSVPSQVQTFALSMFANPVQDVTGPDLGPLASAQITRALANAAPTIGDWQIVWGPAVLSQTQGPAYSVNSMYVVQSAADPSQYVVAIAGTNFNSAIDALIEDCLVFRQVPWVYSPAAAGAKIALGNAIGLLNLQNMKPDATLPGGGTTLLEFLATLVSRKVQITVAGHSLGGALAPTVALWLADTAHRLLLPWDPRKNATIGAQSFAGPTAGNSAFARYAGFKLGSRLQPLYNSLDVVPHAWQELGAPSFSQLFTLYAGSACQPPVEPDAVLTVLIGAFQLLAAGGDYSALPNLVKRDGTYNPGLYSDKTPLPFQKFLTQGAYQHIGGYYDWFNYDASWMPRTPQQPMILSPQLAALAQASATPGDFVQALQSRKPRQLQIGGAVVDAPTGPSDPQADRVAAMVEAALAKQAGGSPAA